MEVSRGESRWKERAREEMRGEGGEESGFQRTAGRI